MKRFLAFCLTVLLLAGICTAGVSAKGTETACDGNCAFYPTIIVPGLGQSNVVVVDENGNFVRDQDGKKVSAFPAYLQTGKLLKSVKNPDDGWYAVGFSGLYDIYALPCHKTNQCDAGGLQSSFHLGTARGSIGCEDCC